jgi:hypothetical protein
MVEATTSATSAASVTAPSSTHQTPSGHRPAWSAATCAARRVLPHAADAGQGHQPPVRQDPADARALGLAPDEPGELDREVARDPGPGVAVRRLGSG